MKKATIYNDFGIQYKNGKIYHPAFGWINPLLKNGNKKIGTGVYHFSTLPTNAYFPAIGEKTRAVLDAVDMDAMRGTCACTCANAHGDIICYATKGRYVFDNVRASLMINTFIARHDLQFFHRAVEAQILADRICVVRIHAAGDFFSADYAFVWRDIARRFSNVTFWTYTKVRALEGTFDGLKNANIVKSMISLNGKTNYNFGPAAKVSALYWSLKAAGEDVFFCPCGVPGADNGIHCNVCGACAAHKYVLFLEHSTDYDAKKDPALPLVRACVADSFPHLEEVPA